MLVTKQFLVHIQTKSNLVLRDVDLFQEFESIEAGFTITMDDEKVDRRFEPSAITINERMRALQEIHDMGIKTFAFVGPILPGNPENLARHLEGKADKIFIDRMNYPNQIRNLILNPV